MATAAYLNRELYRLTRRSILVHAGITLDGVCHEEKLQISFT